MNLENYIAKKLIAAKSYKSSISSPIIKIAVLAIAISVLMMIIAVSSGIGLQNKIRDKFASFNGHITVSNYDNNESQVSVSSIDLNLIKKNFTSEKYITHLQGVATKAALIRTEKEVEGVIFKGVDQQFKWQNITEYLMQGRLPNFKNNPNEVMLSNYLAKRLHLKVNDSFNSFFIKQQGKLPFVRKFKIVGIFDSGFKDFDETYFIGSISHIQRMNKWKPNEVGNCEVFIDHFSKITQHAETLNKKIPPTYNSLGIYEKYPSVFLWLEMFDFNILIIIIIMVLVSAVNMIVALLVLILEKTQMIGILKAMGANNWSIRKIFIYKAFYLISRGLIIGNLIAFLFIFAQKYFKIIKLDPTSYYVTEAPVDFNILHIILINLGTIFICIVALILPSYLISKISPVKAIKFT